MYENMEQPKAYSTTARMLHWLVALLVLAQFLLGWTMPDVKRGTLPEGLIAWHLSVGAAIVLAMAMRVIWRATHRPAPADLTPAVKLASAITHLSLYCLLVLIPLAGWANASARGWVVKLFGFIPYPPLSAVGSSFGHWLGDVHGWLAWVLLGLIGIHIFAALFHRFILRDEVINRML